MKKKKHWMKKLGLVIGGVGATIDLYVPGPWLQLGVIWGGVVSGIGAVRNVDDKLDKN